MSAEVHALGKRFQVAWQNMLQEGHRWRRQAHGYPVVVGGGGFDEGVGRVDLEGWGEEVLALGDVALVDLLLYNLVWRSGWDSATAVSIEILTDRMGNVRCREVRLSTRYISRERRRPAPLSIVGVDNVCGIDQAILPSLRVIRCILCWSWGRSWLGIDVLSASMSASLMRHIFHPETKRQYSLPTLALDDHTLNTIYRTVRAGHLANGSDVIALHHVAAHLTGAAGGAGLGCPPFDGYGVAVGVEFGSAIGELLVGRWRRRNERSGVFEAVTVVVVRGGESFVRHQGRGQSYNTCDGGGEEAEAETATKSL
jgi:hypothetical protein